MDIQALLDSPAGIAIKGALIAAFLDFGFGVFAAARDGTFAVDALAAFVRKHLLGRVLPLSLLSLTGYYTGDPAMIAAAGVALTAYAAETLGSIYGSIRPPAQSEAKEPLPAEAINPIPTD
jgi:hypothetical protein